MLLLRVRHIAWKRMSVKKKPSLNKTDSHRTRKKNKDLWYQVKKHISYMYVPSLSCVEYVVASPLKSSKTNRRFKRTQFAQEIRKDPKMKKKTISVTVTYLLIKKTGSSESRSELSSMAELTRVQAECQRYMKSLFNTRVLCGKTGRFTRRGRNITSEATHAVFCRAVHPFLVYFVLFSPVSFFFFF